MLNPDVVPSEPAGPKVLFYTMAAAVLGIMLGLGLALLAEMLDRRVRSANDLIQLLHVPVLGEIVWSTVQRQRVGFLPGPLTRRLFRAERQMDMNQLRPPIPLLTDSRESRIGRILLDRGKLTPAQAEQVVQLQQERGMRFGEAAQVLGFITESDIQQVLAQQFDYPYLQPGEGHFPPQLVAAYQPFSKQVETLRAIRSQLMMQWFAAGHKALALVSADPEESSLFAANLAVVFSQLGEHTVLVDGNLRSPRQHELFKLAADWGYPTSWQVGLGWKPCAKSIHS